MSLIYSYVAYIFYFIRSDFNCGLVQADKPVIYPILEWLLKGLPELKKRAYLAQFLVKINIPSDIIQEDMVAESYEQVKMQTLSMFNQL